MAGGCGCGLVEGFATFGCATGGFAAGVADFGADLGAVAVEFAAPLCAPLFLFAEVSEDGFCTTCFRASSLAGGDAGVMLLFAAPVALPLPAKGLPTIFPCGFTLAPET